MGLLLAVWVAAGFGATARGPLTDARVTRECGVDLRVRTMDGDPVEGAHETLEVEVTQGDDSAVMALRAVFNDPGRYTADFFPTVSGQYVMHVRGTLDDDVGLHAVAGAERGRREADVIAPPGSRHADMTSTWAGSAPTPRWGGSRIRS